MTARSVLVGVDGSEVSLGALRWALRHARDQGAAVTVVMAWQVPSTIFLSPTKTEVDYQRPVEKAFDDLMDRVGEDAEGVAMTRELVEGRPGPVLCRWAENADLLVVGAHGHGGGEGFHLGSAANYCVHHAPCPVLVHRPRRSSSR
jgi:nucleotide-binding universal stress UspA family protein